MLLTRLEVKNFRCHKERALEIELNITKIIGANGSGKTSLIEALYIALTGTSWRATDREIVQNGKSEYRIEVWNNELGGVVVGYNERKTFVINGKKYGRLPREYKWPVVLFDPRDMNLIFASPSRRREYFDGVISNGLVGYKSIVSKYEKALRQRNEVLKMEYVSARDVFSWDVLLAKYGLEMIKRRVDYIKMLNGLIRDKYQSIAGKDDKLAVMYDGMAEMDESKYLAILASGFDRDRMTGWTNYGPHRDSFEFLFGDGVAEMKASRGEIRSMVLAMKFIEAGWLEEATGKRPVVLLDDVFSELDETRQKKLVTNFKNHQIILSGV